MLLTLCRRKWLPTTRGNEQLGMRKAKTGQRLHLLSLTDCLHWAVWPTNDIKLLQVDGEGSSDCFDSDLSSRGRTCHVHFLTMGR